MGCSDLSALDLRTIARALGGEISGRQVVAPGPGHSRIDRSMAVRLSHQSPTGWIVHSYVGDRFDVCRDYVAAKLGLGPDTWKRHPPQPGRSQITLYNVQDDLPDRSVRMARATALWNEASDARGTIVETYLASRGLQLNLVDNVNEVIRYHPRCPWRDETENRTIFVPAMIAAMRSIGGDALQAVHRTRLTPGGAKVDRRMLGIAAGTAIKLDPDDTVTMGLAIGEGIETVLAARVLDFMPAWAVASAGAIASFPVLPGIKCLTLLAENDTTNATAIEVCARRWHEAGREVIVVEPKSGSDLNDAMRGAA